MVAEKSISSYNNQLPQAFQLICNFLKESIELQLPEAAGKIWHGHPVWFLNDNPIVGYSMQKKGIRLMFWSGADFGEAFLNIQGVKFKDASVFINHLSEIEINDLKRCLIKSRDIQWDYKNIVKRKGKLVLLNSTSKSNLIRTRSCGHKYVKSSDCETCQKCEALKKPVSVFLSQISAPARRALENQEITTLEKLAEYSENYISGLHGIGKSVMKKLNEFLKDSGKSFSEF